MKASNIFVTDDIRETELPDILKEVEFQSSHIPYSGDDYVLVQRPYATLHIRFFRKDRIDHACMQTALSPKDFIFQMFKECAGDLCKFHNEKELQHDNRACYMNKWDKANVCRVCGHYLKDGVARVNDYLMFQDSPIQQPICYYDSRNNPDELHKRYLASPLIRKYRQQ